MFKDFQRIHSDFTIPRKSLYPKSMRVVPEDLISNTTLPPKEIGSITSDSPISSPKCLKGKKKNLWGDTRHAQITCYTVTLLLILYELLFIMLNVYCLLCKYWRGYGNPFQYSCLKNPMDREGWQLQSIGLQRVGHD